MNNKNIKDVAENLTTLCDIFESKSIKLNLIKKADKTLIFLDAFFTNEEIKRAKSWLEAYDSYIILNNKIEKIDHLSAKTDAIDARVQDLRSDLISWDTLDYKKKRQLLEKKKEFSENLAGGLSKEETTLLRKYERFLFLKDLGDHAEDIDHIYTALYHYEKRAHYEETIKELSKTKQQTLERLKTVNRGFWVSLIFCIFVFTIPLCIPFAASLYKRKREVSKQLANVYERLKSERHKLNLAHEGAVASEDLRTQYGDLSRDKLKDYFDEYQKLKKEFQKLFSTEENTNFLDAIDFVLENLETLTLVFGPEPKDLIDMLLWFAENLEQIEQTENEINRLIASKKSIEEEKLHETKGYAPTVIRKSFESIRARLSFELSEFEDDDDLKKSFCEVSANISPLLAEAKEIIVYMSNGFTVEMSKHVDMRNRLRAFSNLMALASMELDHNNSRNANAL